MTVFQMVGPDVPEAMAQITQLLMHNGCELRSLAVSQLGPQMQAARCCGACSRSCSTVAVTRLFCIVAP